MKSYSTYSTLGTIGSCLAICLSLVVAPLRAQEQWVNPVKQLLRDGKPVVGAQVTIPSVEIAARMANMGFDFLWIEMEHGSTTLETAKNMILATRRLKAVPIIRIPKNELWLAKRALDVGALGVVFPFTSTPELARQAVAACRYPPVGHRGYGPAVASFRWPASGEGYPQFANRNVVVIILVEDAEGVKNIEEIAAVPGIDAIFIGPSDLSYSLGHGLQYDHPVVKEAIEKIVAAAKRHDVPVGRPAGSSEEVKKYTKQGLTFFLGPSERALMQKAAHSYLEPLGKSKIDPSKPLY